MKKSLNNYPFIVHVLAIPFMYILAILKIVIVIPMFVVAKCNDIMNDIG